MVFQDISNSFELNKLYQKKTTANLMDRFFSFLIDYLVISPFVLFLLYFTFSNGFNFWKANPMAPENDLFIIIFSLGYMMYFCLIQSVFIAFWRATPGQYFLKIRVEFHESEDLIFFRAFFRQIGFCLSYLLLGIPFLAVMTNKNRRTFYDRISDVSIVSTKNETVNFNYDSEYKYWQSFMATIIIFMGFLFSAFLWKNYSKVINRSASYTAMQNDRFFCEQLGNVSLDERLRVAVALNLTNQLSDNCLDKEADFVLWKEKIADYSLAYYAKSLTTEDQDREIDYLKQSCAEQDTGNFKKLTLGCKISYSFLTGQMDRLYDELKDENFLSDSLKYELSLILDRKSDIERNFAKIDKYNELKLIKKYQITEMLSQNFKTSPNRLPAANQELKKREVPDEIIDLIRDL